MFKRSALVLLALYTGFGFAQSSKGLLELLLGSCKCRCGLPNLEGRLLGGEFLKTHEFPWLALIHIKGIISVPGSLINDRYVLTAASSMIGLTPYDLKVHLGAFDRCTPDVASTNVSVERVELHPDFSASNRAHDLALLKLSSAVTIERRISPICLATPGSRYTGQVSTIAGWASGPSQDGELISSCKPRKLGLPVLNPSDCPISAYDPSAFSKDKACIGLIGVPSVVCKSDAGSPVMYRSYNGVYELIGVLTDKNDCTQKTGTILYTEINPHINWISHNTKDACYCYKT